MPSEGDLEVLFFTWTKVKGIFFKHHVNLKSFPLFFHTDGFLEGRGVLHGACDIDHRVVQRVNIEFRLFFVAIELNTRSGGCLGLGGWSETAQHERHDKESQTAWWNHGPQASLLILFHQCDGKLMPKQRIRQGTHHSP